MRKDDVASVLVIEDDPAVRTVLARFLVRRKYVCAAAADAEQAIRLVRDGVRPRLVIADLRLLRGDGPGMADLRDIIGTDVEMIAMAGQADRQSLLDAFEIGVCEVFDKPLDFVELGRKLPSHQARARRPDSLKSASRKANQRASNVAILSWIAKHFVNGSLPEIGAMSRVAGKIHDEALGHCRRVGTYAATLAGLFGWSAEQQAELARAAEWHDLGKLAVPGTIFSKPGPLDEAEKLTVVRHTEVGFRLLGGGGEGTISMAATVALCHHERWDGTGYPRGLKDEDIPIEARLVALGDIYDALRSRRSYKPALDHDEATRIILEGDDRSTPRHFDPAVLQAFASHSDVFNAIYRNG